MHYSIHYAAGVCSARSGLRSGGRLWAGPGFRPRSPHEQALQVRGIVVGNRDQQVGGGNGGQEGRAWIGVRDRNCERWWRRGGSVAGEGSVERLPGVM